MRADASTLRTPGHWTRVVTQEETMSATSTTRPAVVVGVDGSSASRTALDWAVDEAALLGAPLELVHASPMPLRGPTVESPYGSVGEDDVLAAAVERAHVIAPHLRVRTSGGHGSPSPMLVDASRGAALVVVGSRGRGALRSAMLGSTSVDVAAHAHCPVVVVRELPVPHHDRPGVVVGFDGSELGVAAIAEGFREADARSLPLTVVHAWFLDYAATSFAVVDGVEPRRQLAEEERVHALEVLAGWGEKYPDVRVNLHVVQAHPVQALVEHSRGAELVVVGSRGRGGFAGLLLGSVSQGVLHHAHCPVMVVRPQTEDGAS
jgi:nucleotide-binding universal stress UspA family protein